MHRAVFVDRDGTVIKDKGYLADPDGVELLPHAGEALAALSENGFLLVLITNQSGIGRGYFDSETVCEQHRRLARLLEPYGVRLAGIEVCPHAPREKCSCRKPSPQMLYRAADKLNIEMRSSYMVGDKNSDVQAGKSAGCTTIRLGDDADADADMNAGNLLEAANWIITRPHPPRQEQRP